MRTERNKLGIVRTHFAPAQSVLFFRQHHNRASLGSFVGQRRELRRIRQHRFGHARRGNELRRLPVAQRDGSGLVEQQSIHVASGFHRASRHRQHVVLHQPVHARNANRRKQSANRGRNQAYQQRHQHEHRLRRARINRERLQRDHGQQKHNRQPGQQNVQRNFIRSLLPLRAFHQRDHAIKKCLAGIGRDLHLHPVRKYARSAGHRRAVAACFANHRRRLACDRRLVHRRHAFHDLAIAGNKLARLHQHHVSATQFRARHRLCFSVGKQAVRHRLRFRAAQRVSLCLAAALGHGFGKVGKQHREPQP